MIVKNVVIAEFHVLKEHVETLEEGFRNSFSDTRAYSGCISIDAYLDETASTFIVVQDWESFEHYDAYLNWRIESGLFEFFDRILVGGRKGFRVRKLKKKDV